MPHPRPFRFGVQLSRADTGAEWAELARRAEDFGYSTLFVPDHFGDQLSPAVGPDCRRRRHDRTAGRHAGARQRLQAPGRHGQGGGHASTCCRADGSSSASAPGWMASDYDQSGIAMDPPGVRIDRLEEALAVLKGLFGPGPFSFEGKHYRVSRARRAARSPCSSRTVRRCSSAGAAGGCSAWPARRGATSSVSTRRSDRDAADAGRRAGRRSRRHRQEARVGA